MEKAEYQPMKKDELKPEKQKQEGFFHWLKTVFAAGAVGGIIVALITTYVNVKLQTRTAIEADFTQFKSASGDLSDVLSEYAKQATGQGSISPDASGKFEKDMLTLFKVGDSIANRKPSLRSDFDEYEKHLLALKQAADQFKGPLDAKTFVEATSSYLESEDQFKDKINHEQSGYFNLLL
jgi:hypothetical protein